MIIYVDKLSRISVYKQVMTQVKSLIDNGTLEINTPLPSARKLAQKAGVNRSTIDKAYKELQALGYLRSRPGSYHIVQQRKKEAIYYPNRKSVINWECLSSKEATILFESHLKHPYDILDSHNDTKDSVVNFSLHQIDPRLFPVKNFARCLRHVLTNYSHDALDYCSAKGNENLRESIARHMRFHGISTSKEEILITNGSQEALSIIILMLDRAKKKIVIEAPTYFNMLPLLKLHQAEIVTVPMNDEGMDLEYLENVLNENKVSLIYTIPNFHNPTGITTSHHHREKLLKIASNKKIPILEDGFEEEMKYYGKVPLPIKSIDEHNIVIYVGTFTKTLFPGIRIGWISADQECINRLTAIKRFSSLRSGNFLQTAFWYFLHAGYYEQHIKKLHRIFRKKMDLAKKTMKSSFPDGVKWSEPTGGFNLWVRLPKKHESEQLKIYMRKFGIIITPGSLFFPGNVDSEYFRISIARTNEEEIEEGIKRLGKALFMLRKES